MKKLISAFAVAVLYGCGSSSSDNPAPIISDDAVTIDSSQAESNTGQIQPEAPTATEPTIQVPVEATPVQSPTSDPAPTPVPVPTPAPAPAPTPIAAPSPAPEPSPELSPALTGSWDIPVFECKTWEDETSTWFWALDNNLRLLDPERLIIGDWSQQGDTVEIVNQSSQSSEWRRENGRTLTISWGICQLVNGPELPLQEAGLIISGGNVFRPTKIIWERNNFADTNWLCGDTQWLPDFSGPDLGGRRSSIIFANFYADGTGTAEFEGMTISANMTWEFRDGRVYYTWDGSPDFEQVFRLTDHDGFYWQATPTEIRVIESPGEYGPGHICEGPFAASR